MPQRSKILQSRDDWKRKAVQRADAIREHRKTQRRYQLKIAQLKADISALEQAEDEKKTLGSP
ncbi:hypothetical protein [Thiocystis violacea]|uniref:hypothetical protein n=1 Tax=Thiocystis violacea TaxID=13725 RepID=UPI00190738C8|nr:hypothetical protein [Thiocystis violacea]MBK1725219.1 hypothetical protein [Thiocystis violacea]